MSEREHLQAQAEAQTSVSRDPGTVETQGTLIW